jgi:cytoskeletal protein RodZ
MVSRSFTALRSARERMGLSLDEAALKTGVEPEVLEAIEQGDFNRLPDETGQVRGWIRAYARLVKVNPSPLLRAYSLWEAPDSRLPEKDETPPLSRSRARRHKNRKASLQEWLPGLVSWLRKRWIWALTAAAVLILSGAFGIWLFTSDEPSSNLSASAPKQADETSQPEQSGEKRPVVTLLKTSESYKYGDLYSIRNAERVEVKVKAIKPTRVRVRGDGPTGEVLKDESLAAGDVMTVQHDQWISLRIDHPDRVQLMVNGVVIDTSDQSEVALYQLKLWDANDGEAEGGEG